MLNHTQQIAGWWLRSGTPLTVIETLMKKLLQNSVQMGVVVADGRGTHPIKAVATS